MGAPLDFYFDFSSPYGYLASAQIDGLAARHGREVVWKPILLGAAFKLMETRPLVEIPLKGDYSRRDIARTAKYLGVPFNMPKVFPIGAVAATRAFYWAADRSMAAAKSFAATLLGEYFVNGTDISPAATVLDIVSRLGLEREDCARTLDSAAHKERVRREVEQAIQRGVFGSPYIIVDGEPFWGSDRLDQVERWLATGGW